MKLSDIMGAMELHMYAEVAMVIFMTMFVVVVVHILRRANAERFEQARFMPLDDENPVSPRFPERRSSDEDHES